VTDQKKKAIDSKQLLAALRGFALTLASGYEISDVFHDLTRRVTRVLAISGAGVSVMSGDKLRFATSDTERFVRLERVQEEHQAGPCVEAVRSREAVAIADPAGLAGRWPLYEKAAALVGVVAVAGVPMRSGGDILGALNLYVDHVRHWNDDEIDVAQSMADMATSYVVNASKLDQERRTTEQLELALRSRLVIEQAKGVLAAHYGISIDAAFALLRKHARRTRRNLHVVSYGVVNYGDRLI
jgi:GAF domain-containing protein